MATTGQGTSSMEIEQIIAQRVSNAIKAITIYEERTRVTRDSMDQVARQGTKVVKDVKNKREWESGYDRKSRQQQRKRQKVAKAYVARPNNKRGYAGNCRPTTIVNYITRAHALLSAKSIKRLAIMRKTVELGLQLQVIHRTFLFSLPERLKADNTIRVNQIVTIFLIESSIHILDQNRYPVDTSLIHLESRKSPTVELFDVDSEMISIHHCKYLRVSL
ncbi:hypothetical protein Tco_0394603 [Tanacetum coccineum]